MSLVPLLLWCEHCKNLYKSRKVFSKTQRCPTEASFSDETKEKEAFKDDHEEETNVTYLIDLFKSFKLLLLHAIVVVPYTQPN